MAGFEQYTNVTLLHTDMHGVDGDFLKNTSSIVDHRVL